MAAAEVIKPSGVREQIRTVCALAFDVTVVNIHGRIDLRSSSRLALSGLFLTSLGAREGGARVGGVERGVTQLIIPDIRYSLTVA